MSAAAWLLLWQAGASPYVHYVHHGLLHAPTDGSPVSQAAIFVAGWTVMTVAMMLPTTFPLVTIFGTVVGSRPKSLPLMVLLSLGYIVVWTAAGMLAYGLVVSLREAAARAVWLRTHPWALGSAACLAAGAFQFSSIKYACLEKCRSPFTFVAEHWSGTHEYRDAFRLGFDHGLYCVGCCWALMLLMIPVGAGNVGWMLALGAVMALEKNGAWGRAAVRPVGVGLILVGIVLAIQH